MNEVYVILTGCLVAATCSLLGCFLVLRRMVMIGDAISHAVLPGIVIAYLLSGSRDSIPLLIGAAATGFLTTLLIEILHQKVRLQQDASIGVVFTLFFAVGVVLISHFASKVDLDQDCVLYGEIAYVGLGEAGVPMAVKVLGAVFLIVATFVSIFYKQLKLISFDPGYATSIGVSVILWHYLLMGLVSITTVASFDAVGAILVIAFLIAPAATAYLLTDKLSSMLTIAVAVGIAASIGGYFLAVWTDGSIAGAMSVIAGTEFMLAFLLAPKTGFLYKKSNSKFSYTT